MQTYFLDQTHYLYHLLVWFSYHACGFWFCLFGIHGSVSLFSFQIQTQRGKEACFHFWQASWRTRNETGKQSKHITRTKNGYRLKVRTKLDDSQFEDDANHKRREHDANERGHLIIQQPTQPSETKCNFLILQQHTQPSETKCITSMFFASTNKQTKGTLPQE